MTAQTAGVKVTATLVTFILMGLLTQEDYGLYGLALSVRALLDITGGLGMREILVQRQKNFRRWVTPAFWMTMTIGCSTSLILALSAPLLARSYGEPQLKGMIWVLACVTPFLALGLVPLARLQATMRFKAIATVEFSSRTLQLIATILLAWRGFGAYSFVIPIPFMELGRAVAYWRLASPRVGMHLRLRRWKLLIGDSSTLLASNMMTRILGEADYLILAAFQPTAIVGAYTIAFRLSTQTMRLITQNLTQTLLPALAKLQETGRRQMTAFLRATRLLGLIYTPVGLLQAVLADPGLRLLYGAKYEQVIPLLQILSVGMMFRIMNGPSTALLRAQGRFKLNLAVQTGQTITFLTVVVIAAQWSAVGVAIGVSVVAAVYGPVQAWIGIRIMGGTWRDVLSVFRVPTSLGVVAFGCAYGSFALVPVGLKPSVQYGSQIVIATLLGCGLYGALLRWVFPSLCRELFEQLGDIHPLIKRLALRPLFMTETNVSPDSSSS